MDGVTEAALQAWLKTTPQVVRAANPEPWRKGEYVKLSGTDVQGFVSADLSRQGTLANGQRVMIVPLDSGGSGTVFASLIYTVIDGRTRFVGYIPSPAGHLGISVTGGRLEVRTPVYLGNDANCCPSRIHIEHDTLRGIRLVKLDAHDEKPPPP